MNYSSNEIYLFLDEIQEVEEWHKLLEYLRTKGFKVVCSGSNSKLLEKEVRSMLTGRTHILEIFPLSFKDFLSWRGVKINEHKLDPIMEKKVKEEVKNYLMSSLPEYVKYEEKERVISTYNDILTKDIYNRHNIYDKKKFRELSIFLLNEITHSFTYNSLKNKFQIDIKTIRSFLYYLEESYLFHFLNPFSPKLIEQIRLPKKVYISDNGFYNFIKLKTTRDMGKLMENAVFINLRRKFIANESLYYYITSEGYEVDFLIKEGTKIKELIQVSYANSYEDVQEREIRSLLHAKEDLKLGNDVPLTIITWDYENEKQVEWWRKKGRIRFVPLWRLPLEVI